METRTEFGVNTYKKDTTIRIEDIEAFRAEHKYVVALTRDGASHLLYAIPENTIKRLLDEYGPQGNGTFIRIARSILVSLAEIDTLYKHSSIKQTVQTKSGIAYKCTRREARNVRLAIAEYAQTPRN